MSSNEVEAIKRALKAGDDAGARRAYGVYEQKMLAAKQRPQPPSSFGVKGY